MPFISSKYYTYSLQSGMSVWHHTENPDGMVVELHGNVRYLVCPACEHIAEAKPGDLIQLKKCKPRVCQVCHGSHLRFKIMLYDDEEAEKITPEDVWQCLEDDLAKAELIIWVGISFEQV
jgi:NAD-dependent SIR2 family protein deacetylase